MFTVQINEQQLQLEDGEKLNAIQAAQRVGIEIPQYCWHPTLTVVASCRMCLIETGQRKPDGSTDMVPKLVPGCQLPVKDGTVIVTNSPRVEQAQKATLEYLLLNHPLDCPVCDQAGECLLQDYSYRFGRGHTRLQEPKLLRDDKDNIGDQITLFTDRCVMCTRCVRFTREISGTSELQVIQRGSHAEIDIFPGQPCNNKLAGNVVDLCPVGALCSKDFLYKQRVWWLQTTSSVCPNCSTGCSIHVEQNNDVVHRLRPRVNPQAQGYYMCDEGRFGWKYIHSPDRIRAPQIRGTEGALSNATWTTAFEAVRKSMTDAGQRSGESVAGVFSPWMTVEEAYLLASFLQDLSPNTRMALGPVPTVGEDDYYPKDVQGNPSGDPTFVIRAEKCPNRRGVEAVLRHFRGQLIGFDELLRGAARRPVEALYLIGGYDQYCWTDEHIERLKQFGFLVVQDILSSPLTAVANVVLAGGSFAEKDGTFVNQAGLAQSIRRSIHSPGEARPDGRILWELCGRSGLFHPGKLRQEIAQTIPELSRLKSDLGEGGVRLFESAPESALAMTTSR